MSLEKFYRYNNQNIIHMLFWKCCIWKKKKYSGVKLYLFNKLQSTDHIMRSNMLKMYNLFLEIIDNRRQYINTLLPNVLSDIVMEYNKVGIIYNHISNTIRVSIFINNMILHMLIDINEKQIMQCITSILDLVHTDVRIQTTGYLQQSDMIRFMLDYYI